MISSTSELTAAGDIAISGQPLSIAQVHAVALGKITVRPDDSRAVRETMEASVALVDQAVEDQWQVYGVTTGFGSMSDVVVPAAQAAASQNNLMSFLAASVGNPLDQRHTRAAMFLRANVLLQGLSGVRFEIVERICRFLSAGLIPLVRDLGSIGASGDLVPLSAIARCITGHQATAPVHLGDRVISTETALAELGLVPLTLEPKEGLAIVNGTSFSSAIAANCVAETRSLLGLTVASQAMMLRALRVQEDVFDPFVHACKPHPGQNWTARTMRELLATDKSEIAVGPSEHVQDRYSLRCLPQYMGPLVEGVARVRNTVEVEMNSVSDNPLIDRENERFCQGGNFLGQYVGLAMDDLRRYIGLLAKHLDVQIAQMVSPEFSRGLPPSLRGNESRSFNMGLKGLQIAGNSIAPMLTYYGNPLVEHYPTHAEQFNQNVNGLSWGAANLAWRSVELFQHYAAIALIFSVQALDLRARQECGRADGRLLLGECLEPLYETVHEILDIRPAPEKPLVFDDSDQILEEFVQALHLDIAHGDELSGSIDSLLKSFDAAPLAC